METNTPKHVETYYERMGQCGHDYILRCDDCKSLVLHSALVTKGGCNKCGNRRMQEIRGLTLLEWLKIKLGILQFPYSDLFLAEFGPKGWWNRG